MRIVYIHQHYRTPEMIGGTRSYEFARRLAARGHTVNLIAASVSGVDGATASGARGQGSRRDGWTVTEEHGVTVHWCPVPYAQQMGFTDRMAAFSRFAVRATSRALRLPQDVVFATSTPLTVGIPGVFSARWHRVPLVFEVRDVWPEVPIAMGILRSGALRGLASGLEAWIYRNSHTVVALSPGMAGSIASRFPDVDVTVIPNASDLELFSGVGDEDVRRVRNDRPWLGNRPLLVYTGTFGPVNNVGYLVELADGLAGLAPEVRVLLVGDGKLRRETEELARRRGVLGRNLFVEPSVSKKDVPALLAAATMCFSVTADVPALASCSPNKVFDAFAAGRPVVINHGGWLAGLLRDSGAGLVVPGGDPRSAAAAVAARVGDETWLRAAGCAARRLAVERFDRDLLFRRWEQVLRDAVAASRRQISSGRRAATRIA